MKEKRQPDTLLIMAIIVLAAAAAYIAWCWAAKILWSIDPPEGTSITAVAAVISQLFVGGGIQVFKKLGKTAKVKELEEDKKKLLAQFKETARELNKFRKAAGLDQLQIPNI